MNRHAMNRHAISWREALLLLIGLAVIIAAAMFNPIAQDPDYFEFADQQRWLGIPNFLNVISNLPFLLIGAAGLRWATRMPPGARTAWLIFFAGIVLTAFGSAYFHMRPDNASLVWDRLPMTISFMSLFSIILGDYVSPKLGERLLLPLLAAGAASVAWWAWTESQGAGDLRPYAIVQFLPLLLIPVILMLYRGRSGLGVYLGWMLGFYAAAKLAEYYDQDLFTSTRLISGHSIKHLLAACAPAALLLGLRRRQSTAGQQALE